MNGFLTALQKYATFSGRSRRREYWQFVLIYIVIMVVLSYVDSMLGLVGSVGIGLLSGLFMLALLVPSWAVGVRRMHDIGRSGWWILINFVPFGFIVFLIMAAKDSQPATNDYGPSPKALA